MMPDPGLADGSSRTAPVRPFLKWAGGKRQLLPVLRRFYPSRFGTYFEPFLGSGAVFFDLYNSGRLEGRQAVLIDSNIDLIGCYSAIRDNVEAVIRQLLKLAREHARRGEEFFYEVRDREFNPRRKEFVATGKAPQDYPVTVAAMLIYLNRSGFNGLFRLNANGNFNVPAGRYSNPQICDETNLRLVSAALRTGVQLIHGSFHDVGRIAKSGDFLYFDPPYAPLTKTARFTSYTANQFTATEQQQLHGLVVELSARGCQIVVSNSTADEIADLYESSTSRNAGLLAHRVDAKRAINSNPGLRGSISEYVLSNGQPSS